MTDTADETPHASSLLATHEGAVQAEPSEGQVLVTYSTESYKVCPSTEAWHMDTFRVPPGAAVTPRSSLYAAIKRDVVKLNPLPVPSAPTHDAESKREIPCVSKLPLMAPLTPVSEPVRLALASHDANEAVPVGVDAMEPAELAVAWMLAARVGVGLPKRVPVGLAVAPICVELGVPVSVGLDALGGMLAEGVSVAVPDGSAPKLRVDDALNIALPLADTEELGVPEGVAGGTHDQARP